MTIDQSERSIDLSVSSEYPVKEWYGYEILDHSEKSVILDRFKTGASVRDAHTGDQIGVIERVYIDSANKKLRTLVRFSKSARANEIYQDVIDKIRRNVSIRYRVHSLVLEKKEGEDEYYRATKWEPVHLAFEPDPADPTVGVDRNYNNNQKEEVKMEPNENKQMSEKELELLRTSLKKELQGENEAAIERAYNKGGEKELLRMQTLLDMGRSFKNDLKDVDVEKEAVKFAVTGMNERQFGDYIIAKMKEQKPVGNSIPDKEKNRFSMSRLLMSIGDPNKFKADYERGLCEEYGKERNANAKGIVIPSELIDRTNTVLSATGGGNLVGTNLLGNEFIPIAANKPLAEMLGAVVLPGLVGNIAIPTQTGSIVGAWMGDETTPVSDSDIAIGQKGASPKTFSGTTSFSRQLLLQSTPQIDMLIEQDLQRISNLAIDKAVIHGTGLNGQPKGIIATDGVGLGTVKTSFTFADLVAMETAVADANLDVNTMAYVTTPTIKGALKTTEKASGYPVYLWDNDMVNGYRAAASKQINSGFLIHGDFGQIIIPKWGGYDVVVDPYTNKAGLIYVTIHVSMDVILRYAAALSFYKPS